MSMVRKMNFWCLWQPGVVTGELTLPTGTKIRLVGTGNAQITLRKEFVIFRWEASMLQSWSYSPLVLPWRYPGFWNGFDSFGFRSG